MVINDPQFFYLRSILIIQAEELPIRLAHRVKELDELPRSLGEMPSIVRVKNWYAQSFQVNIKRSRDQNRSSLIDGFFFLKELTELSPPVLTSEIKTTLRKASKNAQSLPQSMPNLAIPQVKPTTNYHPSVSIGHRYI